jgi:hypothetical protein
MNLLVLALKAFVPMSIKRQKLLSLFETSARAFGAKMPELDHLSFEECLVRFARFTNHEVECRLRAGDDMPEVRNALYRQAYAMGKEIREQLHIKTRKDALSVERALYRAIGIDFKGKECGAVVIRSCFFSRYYSEETCRIMSSLDGGITAGLSAGGKLSFSQRITEGMPCCKACIDFEGASE